MLHNFISILGFFLVVAINLYVFTAAHEVLNDDKTQAQWNCRGWSGHINSDLTGSSSSRRWSVSAITCIFVVLNSIAGVLVLAKYMF